MKRYLLTLPLLLFAALGLTSCIEDLSETKVSYQDQMSYGVWKSVDSNDEYDYTITFTKSAAGKDIVSVVREGKADGRFAGEVRNLFVSEEAEYSPELGISASGATATYYGDGEVSDSLGASFYLVEMNDHSHIAQLITDDASTRVNVRVEPANIYPAFAGYWEGYNADSTLTFYALFDGDEPLAIVGKTAKAGGSEDPEEVVVDFDRTTGKGSFILSQGTDEERAIEFAYNSDAQVVVTVDGEQFVIDPIYSDSEPESFLPVYTATFTSSLFGYSDPTVTIYAGDKGVGNFAFGPYIDAEAFFFTKADDNTISFDKQATGYEHVQDGRNFGMVYAYDAFNDAKYKSSDQPSYYDPAAQTFHFFCDYFIPSVGGGFGLFEETLTITEELSEEARAKVRLKNAYKGYKRPQHVLPPFSLGRLSF